jgi:hypothetical protein
MSTLPRIYVPATSVENWRPLLGRPSHLKEGRSAHAIATRWLAANDFPPRVRAALSNADDPALRKLELLLAIPEHRTLLPPARGRASQSDLLVLARGADVLVALTIEGKVDEPFGESVAAWLGSNPSPGKSERLAFIVETLGLEGHDVAPLRYQLLHRTVSAVLEARRFTARHAVMLVHSFDPRDTGWPEYADFVHTLGGEPAPDAVTRVRRLGSGDLSVGWARDEPPALSSV